MRPRLLEDIKVYRIFIQNYINNLKLSRVFYYWYLNQYLIIKIFHVVFNLDMPHRTQLPMLFPGG